MQWDSKNSNCNIYFTAVFITRLGYASFPVGFGFIALDGQLVDDLSCSYK